MMEEEKKGGPGWCLGPHVSEGRMEYEEKNETMGDVDPDYDGQAVLQNFNLHCFHAFHFSHL